MCVQLKRKEDGRDRMEKKKATNQFINRENSNVFFSFFLSLNYLNTFEIFLIRFYINTKKALIFFDLQFNLRYTL